eukprot:69071-Amorphochlora_amoeboformis.AAC.1
MMNLFKLNEQALIKWSRNPKEMVNKLREMYRGVDSTKRMLNTSLTQKTKECDILKKKNEALIKDVAENHEWHQKAVLRFNGVFDILSTVSMKLVNNERMRKRGQDVKTKRGLADRFDEDGAKKAFITEEEDPMDADAFSLPSLLQGVPYITTLKLGGTGMEDSEALVLANTLQSNTLITEINLRSNQIGDKGFVALAFTSLSKSSRIILLDLQYNLITMKGVAKLAGMIDDYATSGGPITSASFVDDDGVLLPVLEIDMWGGRTVSILLRHNKLKREVKEDAPPEEHAKADKELDSELNRIIGILSGRERRRNPDSSWKKLMSRKSDLMPRGEGWTPGRSTRARELAKKILKRNTVRKGRSQTVYRRSTKNMSVTVRQAGRRGTSVRSVVATRPSTKKTVRVGNSRSLARTGVGNNSRSLARIRVGNSRGLARTGVGNSKSSTRTGYGNGRSLVRTSRSGRSGNTRGNNGGLLRLKGSTFRRNKIAPATVSRKRR